MSSFYYIAANRELPTGSFGKNFKRMTMKDYLTNVNPAAKDQFQMQVLLEKYPEGDRLVEIYDTEVDAAGLYVTGPFSGQETSDLVFYDTSKKCLAELFDYLHRNMEAGEEVELYSCWAFGLERFSESPIREHNFEIELSSFQLGNEFEWKKRQYIRVRK
ncbi:hypothetical protein ACFQ3W_02280 [Paenibacillus puldeungensis]|uniref:Uncharacterized protein n=1 Tax=Paenibacillus puldeungensis TaxID=696536 RepID=A0ABW3RRN9_9BACL